MDVVSHSPLPVASVLWQSRPSVWILTYVAKATFELQPGRSTLKAQQHSIHEEDRHWDDDPAHSLYAASDLEPFKPRVDVVLVGSAFAPKGQTVRSLFARLTFGEIDKSIEVYQDRTLHPDNTVLDGHRFSRMSLAYERAGGGSDTTNPVGVRFDQRDAYGRLKLPNLQPVGVNEGPGVVSVPPIGFGPIAPRWPVRLAKLGRFASSWSRQWLKSSPVPEDFDWSFFNSAPQDQQLPELPDDSRLILENLHPEIPRLVTSFSALRPGVTIERRGQQQQHPQKMRCDTLWIDTDHGVATMTFRGQLRLDAADEPGRVIITLEEGAREGFGAQGAAGDPKPQMFNQGASPSSSGGQRSPEAPPSKPPPPPPSKRAARTLMILPDSDNGSDENGPTTGIVKFSGKQISVLPFAATASVQPNSDEPGHAGAEHPRSNPAPGLPFVQTGSRPGSSSAVQPPQSPAPASTPPPPLPSAHPFVPGRIAPPSPAIPPLPQPPAEIAPPMPVNVSAVPPPPPPARVPPPPPSSPQSVAPTGSVWAASGAAPRPEAAPGQTMGQLAAAAAAIAAQAPTQDGSSGVLGASNAAANASGLTKRDDKPAGSGTGGISALNMAGARPSSKFDARDILHLIWYQPESVPRICKVPVWRSIIEALEEHPADDRDTPPPAKDPTEFEDTRDVFEILVRAASQDIDQLGEELQSAVRPGGKFVPPLLLLAGELAFPFEERETFKATVATVAPMAGNDEQLKAVIKEAREFLASPDEICPGTVLDGYTARIREAYQRTRRVVSFDQLEVQIERALLEGRHYQKRQVFGMNAIRALLHTGTGSSSVRPVPVYLPDELAKKLPLYQKFRSRLIVELYMQEDQYEQHAAALKVLALGRVQAPADPKRGA